MPVSTKLNRTPKAKIDKKKDHKSALYCGFRNRFRRRQKYHYDRTVSTLCKPGYPRGAV